MIKEKTGNDIMESDYQIGEWRKQNGLNRPAGPIGPPEDDDDDEE